MNDKNSIYAPAGLASLNKSDVSITNPDPEAIDIVDIAHSLANINRYNGASDRNITVLSHLVLCGHYVKEEYGPEKELKRLAVLLHDAHEAIIGDITRPVKRVLNDAAPGVLKKLEHTIDVAIWKSIGLDWQVLRDEFALHNVIKEADNMALAAEVMVVWPSIIQDERWADLPVPREYLVKAARDTSDQHFARGFQRSYPLYVKGLASSVKEKHPWARV